MSAFAAAVTFVQVQDLEATSRFYGELLELELALDQGPCRIYRVTPSAYLGFCTHREGPSPEGVILTLVTPDVDARCAELRARGVVFESGPKTNERFRIYHAFLRDPDGYLVEIQRFDDPAWTGP